MKSPSKVRPLLPLAVSIAALLPLAALAGTTWDGGGGDDNWGTGDNWSPNGTPPVGNTVDLTFDGGVRLTPNNNYTAFDDFHSLTFAATAGAFTLSGNAIDLFGKIENYSTATQTLSMNLAINAGQAGTGEFNPVNGDLVINSASVFTNGNTLHVYGTNGKTVTFGAGTVISQGGAFNVEQASNVIFLGANTYTGTTNVLAGSLTVGNGGTSGQLGTGTATVLAGATLTWNRSDAITVANVLAGAGAFVKAGAGTLTLGGTNTFTGTLTVSNGTVSAAANTSALGAGSIVLGDANTGANNVAFLTTTAGTSRPITVSANGSGTATIGSTTGAGAGNVSFGGLITLNRATTMTAASTDRTTWTGKITGSVGTLTIAGGQRTVLDNLTNDFVGDVVVTGTNTVLQTGVGTGTEHIPNGSSVTVDTGALLKLAGVANSAETINAINGAGTIRRHESVGGLVTLTIGSANGSGAFNGLLENGAGSLALVKSGSGTQTLNRVGGNNAAIGSVTVGGGTLALVHTTDNFDRGYFTGATSITINAGGTVNASSLWTIKSTNVVTVNGGTLNFNSPFFANVSDTNYVNNLTLQNGATISGPGGFRVGNVAGPTLTLNTTGNSTNTISTNLFFIKNGGITTYSMNVADGTAAVDLDVTGNVLDNPSFTGMVLNKTGTGTLRLSGTNSYVGATTVSAGVLQAGSSSAFGASNPAATSVVVQSGGTVDINGRVDINRGLTLSGTGSAGQGALTNTGAGQLGGNISTPNITLAANATIGGTGNIMMIAGGYAANALTLGGNTLTITNTDGFYLANSTVSAGTIAIAAGARLSQVSAAAASTMTSAAITMADATGTRFELNGKNLAIGSLSGGGSTGGTVALGANTLTVGALNTSTAFGGVISGTGGNLTKTGTGTFTLSGANDFTGTLSVQAGTLATATINNASAAGPLGQSANAVALGNTGGVTGTLQYTGGTASSTKPLTLAAGGTGAVQVDTAATTLTLTGTVGGTGALLKSGAGKLILTSANGYSGGTTVRSGTLEGQSNTAFGGGAITLGDASTGSDNVALYLGNRADVSNAVTVSALGTGTVTLGANNTGSGANAATFLGTITLNRPTIFSGEVAADRLAMDGQITGNVGTLTVTGGSRTTFLSTLNNFTGDIVVTGAGTILQASVATAAEVIPNASSVTVDAGAVLQLASGSGAETINALNGAGTVRTFSAGTFGSGLVVGSAGGSGAFSGSLQNGTAGNPLSLTKSGAGTQTLTGGNTFTGATLVSGGTLEAGAAGALGSTANVTINTGGTLLLSGSGDRVNNAAAFTLAGGTFATGGFSETVGTLTLSASSVIDMGAGASVLRFADSSAPAIAALWSGTLSIWNWSGNQNIGGGTDQLFFGNGSGTGLTAGQLSQIKFYSDAGTTILPFAPGFSAFTGGFGEVVPVPEPSSVATVLGLLGIIGWRERGRMRAGVNR